MIWKNSPSLEGLNNLSKNTINENIGIEFIEIGNDYIVAKMPVDQRTKQPMGLLHGGASLVLAETLGSIASVLLIDDLTKEAAVGIEINANHLNSTKNGYVFGTVRPIKTGRRIHVWEIKIKDESNKPICVSRLTTMIIQNSVAYVKQNN